MNKLSVWTMVVAGNLIAAASAYAGPSTVPLGGRLGDPLPGGEFGLIAIAAGGIIGGILIARRKR